MGITITFIAVRCTNYFKHKQNLSLQELYEIETFLPFYLFFKNLFILIGV